MIQRPFIGLALGMLVGIVLASLWSIPIGIYFSFFVFVSVLGGWLFYQYRKGLLLILFFMGMILGGGRYEQVNESNRSQLLQLCDQASVTMVGEIASAPLRDGDRCSFDFVTSRVQLDGEWASFPVEKIRVTLRLQSAEEIKKSLSLQRFDTIVTSVHLKTVSPPRNPGAFNYRAFLYYQRIHTLGEIQGVHSITVLKKSVHPYVYIDQLRETIAHQIESIYSSNNAGTIRGMLLGERDQVDPKLIEDYSTLGIIHLLSISGLHVGVFVATLYFLLMLLGLTRERAALFIFCTLPAYAILTGAGAPVVRACIMGMLALLAVILRKFKDALSFLGLALVLQLLWDPYQLFGAGFQLSFIITAALIVGVPPLVRRIRTPWNALNQAIAVTMIAQLSSFPILIYHFHSFSILSWLVNLIAVPLFSIFVIPLSLLALAISVISHTLGEFVAFLSSLFLFGVQCTSDFFLQFSWAHMNWAEPSLFWLMSYYGSAIYFWIGCVGGFEGKKHFVLASFLLLMVTFYAHHIQNWFRHETNVTFLDVGQGDCAVIETKEGKTILIDGGGSPQFPRPAWQKRKHVYDVGKQVVVPYLQYRGIRQIDYLIMTHGDADHIGGLQAVAEKFSIHYVLRNSHAPHTKLEKKLMNTLRERGAKIVVPPVGLNWELEPEVEWRFLHPDPSHPLGDDQHSNDDSIVCLLSIYGKKVLMTGDIGVEAEKEILAHWNVGPIDILKVAHHGSRYSTDESWLKSIKPKEAIISVGEKNRYGHPTQEVLNRLHNHRVSVFRTDQVGAITYQFTPQKVARKSMFDAS